MTSAGPTNDEIADVFDEVAHMLASQQADAYRVRAWRRGATELRRMDEPVAAILTREGRRGLEMLPHIGRTLAAAIDEIAHTGRLTLHDRLRGEVSPEDLFSSIPGIGEELASRIHQGLLIDTLEELEMAAHDGRLEEIEGIGPRRASAIADVLSARLDRSGRRRAEHLVFGPHSRPPVGLVLEIDQRYRDGAGAGTLRKVAPRRFNPSGEAWLPVMHETVDGWDFTALFSNTARAHELKRTRDWVVVYYDDGNGEDQCTVVTEYRGPLAGRRVIRGRERECAEHYDHEAA